MPIRKHGVDERNGFLSINYLCVVRGERPDAMEARVGHKTMDSCILGIQFYSVTLCILTNACLEFKQWKQLGNNRNSSNSDTNGNVFEAKGSPLCSRLQPSHASNCRRGWCFILGRKALFGRVIELYLLRKFRNIYLHILIIFSNFQCIGSDVDCIWAICCVMGKK